MGNRFQVCSICSSPPDVRNAVDAALAAREKFRDLAARTSFSKSALWRHSQRCVPKELLARFKAQRKPVLHERFVVSWPDSPHNSRKHLSVLQSGEVLHPSDIRVEDVVFHVRYRPVFSTITDAERRRTRVSARVIEEAYELALAEDSERSANQKPTA